jgi:phosphoglycerate dehydrogenase-like enzyme
VIGFSRSGSSREFFDEVFRIDEFEAVISSNSEEDQIDVLVLCVPGTSDSEGLLSAERIAVLPEKAFVIDVGRGAVIDQEALIEALNDGRIAGAALDVMYPEPLPADHPLWTARNCIITPHISGDMGLPETIDITVNIFCENLKRYAEGKELTNLIDVNAGY